MFILAAKMCFSDRYLLSDSCPYLAMNQRMETCHFDLVLKSVHCYRYMSRVHRERERERKSERERVGGWARGRVRGDNDTGFTKCN